jgi:hypothetical protein
MTRLIEGSTGDSTPALGTIRSEKSEIALRGRGGPAGFTSRRRSGTSGAGDARRDSPQNQQAYRGPIGALSLRRYMLTPLPPVRGGEDESVLSFDDDYMERTGNAEAIRHCCCVPTG